MTDLKQVRITFSLYELEGSLEEMIEKCHNAAEGLSDVRIDFEQERYDDYWQMVVRGYRPRTDAEQAQFEKEKKALAKIKRDSAKRQREHEQKELERLAKKFKKNLS